jgi:hypothetical protein
VFLGEKNMVVQGRLQVEISIEKEHPCTMENVHVIEVDGL